MSGLGDVTGVQAHDADKAEHSCESAMTSIIAAIAMVRGNHVVVHYDDHRPESVDELPLGGQERFALEGTSERLGLPAGPIQGEPGKVPNAIGPAPSPLAVAGQLEIRVDDSVLKTSKSTLAQDLQQHEEDNPGFIDHLQAAIQGDDLPADAPTVAVFGDGKLEFYRDAEQTFISPTFQGKQADHVIDADILTENQANSQPSQDRAEEMIVTVPLSQAESIAGQNSGDSSLADSTLLAEQANAFKAIKDISTGEIKGLKGPGESALDVAAKRADRQADEDIAQAGAARVGSVGSAGSSAAGSDPPSDVLGGNSLAVSSLLSCVMDTCYDPNGGPAKLVGSNYIVERGQDRSVTLTAKDGRGVLFASNGGGEITHNELNSQDFQRLSEIENLASQYASNPPEIISPPEIKPQSIGRSRGIDLE